MSTSLSPAELSWDWTDALLAGLELAAAAAAAAAAPLSGSLDEFHLRAA